MKKFLALFLSLSMMLGLAACGSSGSGSGGGSDASGSQATGGTTISLWSFNIGGFTDASSWDSLIAAFNAEHPDITVEVNPINYQDGDQILTTAINSGTGPDVIFEGPERIVGKTMPARA